MWVRDQCRAVVSMGDSIVIASDDKFYRSDGHEALHAAHLVWSLPLLATSDMLFAVAQAEVLTWNGVMTKTGWHEKVVAHTLLDSNWVGFTTEGKIVGDTNIIPPDITECTFHKLDTDTYFLSAEHEALLKCGKCVYLLSNNTWRNVLLENADVKRHLFYCKRRWWSLVVGRSVYAHDLERPFKTDALQIEEALPPIVSSRGDVYIIPRARSTAISRLSLEDGTCHVLGAVTPNAARMFDAIGLELPSTVLVAIVYQDSGRPGAAMIDPTSGNTQVLDIPKECQTQRWNLAKWALTDQELVLLVSTANSSHLISYRL